MTADHVAAIAAASFAAWGLGLLAWSHALAAGARASPGATSRALALIRE